MGLSGTKLVLAGRSEGFSPVPPISGSRTHPETDGKGTEVSLQQGSDGWLLGSEEAGVSGGASAIEAHRPCDDNRVDMTAGDSAIQIASASVRSPPAAIRDLRSPHSVPQEVSNDSVIHHCNCPARATSDFAYTRMASATSSTCLGCRTEHR